MNLGKSQLEISIAMGVPLDRWMVYFMDLFKGMTTRATPILGDLQSEVSWNKGTPKSSI